MTIAEVGDRFDGDLLGDDPQAVGHDAATDASAAIDELLAGVDTVHLSYGDEDPAEYVRQLCADHLIHGWDLAAATGQDRTLDPELVDEVATWFADREELYRAAAVVGPRAGWRWRPTIRPPRRGRPAAGLVRRLIVDARRPARASPGPSRGDRR